MKNQAEGGKLLKEQIQQFRFLIVWSNEDFYLIW